CTPAPSRSERARQASERYAPTRRFSRTVISGNGRSPCGMCTTPAATICSVGSRVMSIPSNSTRPAPGRISPEIARRRVVLPCPLGPSTTTVSPSPTRSDSEWRTSEPPYPASRFSTLSTNSASSPGRGRAFLASRPQIHRNDAFVAEHVGRRALGDLLTVVEHEHPTGQRLHGLHDVLDEEHRHAVAIDLT